MILFFALQKPSRWIAWLSIFLYAQRTTLYRTLSQLLEKHDFLLIYSFESSMHFPLLFFPPKKQFENHYYYYYYWSIVLIFYKWFNISSNCVHWLRRLNRRRIIFFTYNRWSGYRSGNSFTLNQPHIIRVMSTIADTWAINLT